MISKNAQKKLNFKLSVIIYKLGIEVYSGLIGRLCSEFVEQNADPWYRQPAYVKRNFRLLGLKQGRPSATAKVNKKQEN